jgi:hypothetical protein
MGAYPSLTSKIETDGPRNTLASIIVFDVYRKPDKTGQIYCKIHLRVIVGDDDVVRAYLYVDGGPIELKLDKDALSKLVADRLEGEK